jgi:hypothetical protein
LFLLAASFIAAAICGRFSSVSEPSPVSTPEGFDQIVTLGLGEGGNRRLLGIEADAGLDDGRTLTTSAVIDHWPASGPGALASPGAIEGRRRACTGEDSSMAGRDRI